MAIRSTSTGLQPPPPGKVLASTGSFRNTSVLVQSNRTSGVPSSGTVTLVNVAIGDTVTVGGVVLTAASTQTPGGLNFNVGDFATGAVQALGIRPGDTVTIDGTVLTAGTAQVGGAYNFDAGTRASGTYTVDTFPTTATLTIDGIPLTPAGGARTPGANDYDNTLGSEALIAADISAALNDVANQFATLFVASVLVDVVTVTTLTPGTVGNAITLASDDVSVLASAATLLGGVGTNTTVATSLAAAINDALNVPIPSVVTALGAVNVVNITAVDPGIAGNGITLASSSPVRAAVSAATLQGGGGSDGSAATSLVAALADAGNGLVGRVTSSASSNVVTILAYSPGAGGDGIALASSDGATLAVSGATLFGGQNRVFSRQSAGGQNTNTGTAPVSRTGSNKSPQFIQQAKILG